MPPSQLLPQGSRRAPRCPAHTAELRGPWKSTAAATRLRVTAPGRGGGSCFQPGVRGEAGVWKGATAPGFQNSRCRRRGAAAPRCYGRNVPAGTRCSFLRRQRHCALRRAGASSPARPQTLGRCRTEGPALRGPGRKRGDAWAAGCSPRLMVSCSGGRGCTPLPGARVLSQPSLAGDPEGHAGGPWHRLLQGSAWLLASSCSTLMREKCSSTPSWFLAHQLSPRRAAGWPLVQHGPLRYRDSRRRLRPALATEVEMLGGHHTPRAHTSPRHRDNPARSMAATRCCAGRDTAREEQILLVRWKANLRHHKNPTPSTGSEPPLAQAAPAEQLAHQLDHHFLQPVSSSTSSELGSTRAPEEDKH